MAEIAVTNNEAQQQYELEVDGAVAFLQYLQ